MLHSFRRGSLPLPKQTNTAGQLQDKAARDLIWIEWSLGRLSIYPRLCTKGQFPVQTAQMALSSFQASAGRCLLLLLLLLPIPYYRPCCLQTTCLFRTTILESLSMCPH